VIWIHECAVNKIFLVKVFFKVLKLYVLFNDMSVWFCKHKVGCKVTKARE